MAKPNILVYGTGGSGKSSLINLLIGSDVAKVDNMQNCGIRHNLFDYEKYECEKYRFYEVSYQFKSSDDDKILLKKLIDDIKLEGGIHLLIYVMPKGRLLTDRMVCYKTFGNILFENSVPIIFYVSDCEFDNPIDTYGKESTIHLSSCLEGFKILICGSSGEVMDKTHILGGFRTLIEEARVKTKEAITNAIERFIASDGFTPKLIDETVLFNELHVKKYMDDLNALNALNAPWSCTVL